MRDYCTLAGCVAQLAGCIKEASKVAIAIEHDNQYFMSRSSKLN